MHAPSNLKFRLAGSRGDSRTGCWWPRVSNDSDLNRCFAKQEISQGTEKKEKLFFGCYSGQENQFQWPKVDSVVIIQ